MQFIKPSLVVIGGDGKIKYLHLGYKPSDEHNFHNYSKPLKWRIITVLNICIE